MLGSDLALQVEDEDGGGARHPRPTRRTRGGRGGPAALEHVAPEVLDSLVPPKTSKAGVFCEADSRNVERFYYEI